MKTNSQPSIPGFSVKPRVPITASAESLVTIEPPQDGTTLPVMVRPAMPGVELQGWAALARAEIEKLLLRHGGLLFRGFGIESDAQFQRFIETTSGALLPYLERSSPRSQVSGNIYTSTDQPPDQEIFLHCENSYQNSWPLKIYFYCHVQPEEGGMTPIADTRRILSGIHPEVRAQFAEKGVMYVRNFGTGLGLPWQTVFQTSEPSVVEAYCQKEGIECIWQGSDRLTTRHVRPAICKHPDTGEDLWFNHAVFFHPSTLSPETQKMLRSVLSEHEMPNNSFYGDGSTIEPDVLEHIRSVYAAETVKFPWQRGDILMLDNMLAAHGRTAFRGARKILVGMTRPYRG